jgi:integrase
MREFPAKGVQMPRTPKGTPPSYPKKAHKGQARITVRLTDGRRHDLWLGPFGSPESRKEYRRVLAELEANGGRYPLKEQGVVATGLTVAELSLRFWKYAEGYYRLTDGSPSGELDHFEYALKPLVDLYGQTLADEFGPLKLKAVRQRMIDTFVYHVRYTGDEDAREACVHENRLRLGADPKWGEVRNRHDKGWKPVEILGKKQILSRKVINQRIDHIRRVFKWAVSEELVPSSVYEALKTVAGLRRGRCGTYDKPKVRPVPAEHVEAVLPFLCPQVAAMVQLQRLMGARETEICVIRGRNIDRSGPVWWYVLDPNELAGDGQPTQHKTAHHESSDGSAAVKMLPIGPKAQEILKPWLRPDEDEYLFQPKEARAAQNARRREGRKTPLWPSHVKQQAKKKKAHPKRAPQERYDHHSYARAIARACKKAGVPHWHPHRLKHSCGTAVRKKYGAEASRVYLGHSKLSTTEIYAEKDLALMEKIALEMG